MSALPPKANITAGRSESPLCAITGCEQSQQATGTIASLAKPMIRSRGMLFEHATAVN
jgi:hypothetical protein